MIDKIDELDHPDSIWTWKTAKGRRKATLWLPYFQSVEKAKPKSKFFYRFNYNGGSFEADLRLIDCIMIYGATGNLPVSFLDSLSVQRIHLLIHRRGMPQPYVFLPSQGNQSNDSLTAQILTRNHTNKRIYIARSLIKARLTTISLTVPLADAVFKRLNSSRSLSEIRNIEAQATKRYWRSYYNSLGLTDAIRRDKTLPINQALDACSFFLFGIILRWVTLHRLSPWHGFLHEPTTYASLCYDLMEPYRYWFEDAAKTAWSEDWNDPKEVTSRTLSRLKEELETSVRVPQTRQIVARKNLLHGITLALLSYLNGVSQRFVVPSEGIKRVGRPLKSDYRIPGGKLKDEW